MIMQVLFDEGLENLNELCVDQVDEKVARLEDLILKRIRELVSPNSSLTKDAVNKIT